MKGFSVCHSISKQEHKILGRSMDSSADLNLQKGYYIPESVTPRICTGDTRLEATDCLGFGLVISQLIYFSWVLFLSPSHSFSILLLILLIIGQ